ARSFSATTQRYGSGLVDQDLARSLQAEIDFETENEEKTVPEFLKEFQQRNTFRIEDIPGQSEVTLTRRFGKEAIQVLFSISDINNAEEAMPEEEEDEEDEEPLSLPFAVRCNISITKGSDNGCLNLDTITEDTDFGVESIVFYKDAKLAKENTDEADWKRGGCYVGPNFGQLEEGLKENVQKYLEDRGFDEYLASFLPKYIEYKEQKEYVQWLKDVKAFVE
ncbi:mitochondrial glyco protein, partial [Basidiobolus meristosporus CBS 931.73]